jgi:hypothetical protein
VTRVSIAAGALAAAAAAAVLVIGRSSSAPAIVPAAPVAVRTAFEPSVVAFGDAVTARVVVLLDRGAVRPRSLHITDDLAPLTQLAAPSTVRSVRGRLETLSITQRVACLTDACLVTPLHFPRARVTVSGRTASSAWSPLVVKSRVTAADLAAASPHFEADTAPGAPSYRFAPATVAPLLDVVAIVAAVGAVALAGLQALAYTRRRRPAVADDELRRALRLAHEAEDRPVPDRRRALGLVARLIGGEHDELGRAADDLAWSEPKPESRALHDLVSQVERERAE